MIALIYLISLSIFWYGKCISSTIPLASYNLKLYCRIGQSHIPETRVPSLCPSSSTSCGYFEFEKILLPGNKEEPFAFYECVDSSILMLDNDDNDELKQILFSKYCDDQARCRDITLSSFNPKFVQYLINRNDNRYLIGQDDDKLQRILRKRIKFCCAINDHLLQKIIHSGDNVLSTLAPSEPMFCNNVHCRGAPIGCLIYWTYNRTKRSKEEDVIIVQPVHINYEDYTIVSPQPTSNKYMTKYTVEHHCVYRHFNDEFYRYCLLIHDQPSKDQCFYGDGYQICCCFLHRGARTCDPLSTKMITETSTKIPEVVSNKSTVSLVARKNDINIKHRTRCRFTYEMLPGSESSVNHNRRKKLFCETNKNKKKGYEPAILHFLHKSLKAEQLGKES
ncbi:ATP synthase subunit alpha, chloroplastic [Dirofilaria immitis]